ARELRLANLVDRECDRAHHRVTSACRAVSARPREPLGENERVSTEDIEACFATWSRGQDPSREPLSCVLCLRADQPMTREHVFARWLVRQLHGGRLVPS